MPESLTRRALLGAASALGIGLPVAARADDRLALKGGTPVRRGGWPGWPVIGDNDERAWMGVLRRGRWFRFDSDAVSRFESAWAERLGAKHCLATSSGTTALVTALAALDVGPGDEVIVPPYTFIATVNAVLLHRALPVFVDSELDTFQIDAAKIEAAITPRTRAILPVHLGGAPADMDAILAISRRRGIPVIEDACQAHLGEWRGKRLGSLGALGCFSFQASKNLNSGEGGAVVTSDPALHGRCFAFHNQGFPPSDSVRPAMGCNLRMTEFQGTLLLEQMSRVEEQSRLRSENADYLTRLLREIPGITPQRLHAGCTRNAWHLYMFRYDPAHFQGAPRARFLQALSAEGVPCYGGYGNLNKAPFLRHTLESRGFQRIYGDRIWAEWQARAHCPVNDQLCEQAVWLGQTMLLGSRRDMEQIAEAVRKIQRLAGQLA